MNPVDDTTLSSYLDGELDYDRAKTVTVKIYQDHGLRDRLVGMATSQVLLKSLGREKARQEIPDSLTAVLQQRKRRKIFPIERQEVLKAAAVALLFVGSFFLGRSNSSIQQFQPAYFPVIPASLEKTISDVLEYQKSGTIQDWVKIEKGMAARITPVRSFRGSQGEFYRMFMVDMELADSKQHFWGLAIRSGKENWQTKGVFTNGNPGSI